MSRVALSCIFILLLFQNALSEPGKLSRQKRCIVIQKQSGTHGDSTEGDGDDEDSRIPQLKNPKQPKPPKLDKAGRRPLGPVDLGDRVEDAEEFSPELQKFRKRLDRLRRKKIF